MVIMMKYGGFSQHDVLEMPLEEMNNWFAAVNDVMEMEAPKND